MSDSDQERHATKMAKKKAARDKIMATKTDKKGLIIVNTGKGKGKSSAAFGMIFRCIAHDMKCGVVQFIKGGMSTGERDLILPRSVVSAAPTIDTLFLLILILLIVGPTYWFLLSEFFESDVAG